MIEWFSSRKTPCELLQMVFFLNRVYEYFDHECWI